MVYRNTSCTKRRRGFTLVEVMIASSIGLMVLAAAMVLIARQPPPDPGDPGDPGVDTDADSDPLADVVVVSPRFNG